MRIYDRKFKEIDNTLDFYRCLIPVNGLSEKETFFRTGRSPVFRYQIQQKNIDLASGMLDETGTIPENSEASPLYRDLRDEYRRKITMLRALGDPLLFSETSSTVYGKPSTDDITYSRSILENGAEEEKAEHLPPELIKTELETLLKELDIPGWAIELTANSASKVTVKPLEKRIYIKSDLNFYPEEAARLKVHEILVHLFRAENGRRQKYGIFEWGLAGYLEAEEGLAVYMENRQGVCPEQQMKIYAGRLLAVSYSLTNSFSDTFNMLRKWFAPDIAYRLTARVKRGLTDTGYPGALTKDIHYITGYRRLLDLSPGTDTLALLYTGKVSFASLPMVSRLMKTGELGYPAFFPWTG